MVRRSLSAAPAKGLSRRGSAVIYMLMALVEAMRTRQGATLCCQLRRAWRDRSASQTTTGCGKTICWSSSGAASEAIYTLLNQTFEGLPPLLLCHMVTASSFQTQISLSYSLVLSSWCSAPGFCIQSNYLETALVRFFLFETLLTDVL